MSEVIVFPAGQNETASKFVSNIFVELIKRHSDAVLGLATGSTPLAVYTEIANEVKKQNIDVSKVKGFALDEYVGIDKFHPESYYSIIRKHVTEQIGLNPELICTPNGDEATIQTAGEAYDRAILEAGGIDIQILGVGTDGHIGFNEPGSSLASRTRIKTLTEQTRHDNARFFDSIDEVPKHCITQGIGTILEAKHLVLLAFGEAKAKAIADAVEGPVSSSCPASAIQLHPHVTVVVDEEAAKGLKNLEYYKWAFENKPDWQKC